MGSHMCNVYLNIIQTVVLTYHLLCTKILVYHTLNIFVWKDQISSTSMQCFFFLFFFFSFFLSYCIEYLCIFTLLMPVNLKILTFWRQKLYTRFWKLYSVSTPTVSQCSNFNPHSAGLKKKKYKLIPRQQENLTLHILTGKIHTQLPINQFIQ